MVGTSNKSVPEMASDGTFVLEVGEGLERHAQRDRLPCRTGGEHVWIA